MIVVQVYQRAEHAIQVFESLEKNRVDRFIVAFDKAGSAEAERAQAKIVAYLDQRKKWSVEMLFNNKRLGLAKSVIQTTDRVLARYKKIIFLEDDCIVRSGGIQYFTDGLKKLEKNPRVRTICGYSYPIRRFHWGENPELMLIKRFSSWGWATWSDRWSDYTNNLLRLVEMMNSQQISFQELGADVETLLSRSDYLDGQKDIWSLGWLLQHHLTDSFAVFPREALIDNIGLDGSGVHCDTTAVFENSIHRSTFVLRDWENLTYYPQNELEVARFMNTNSHHIY